MALAWYDQRIVIGQTDCLHSRFRPFDHGQFANLILSASSRIQTEYN